MYSIKNSSRKDKKYMLVTPDGKKIHFGDLDKAIKKYGTRFKI